MSKYKISRKYQGYAILCEEIQIAWFKHFSDAAVFLKDKRLPESVTPKEEHERTKRELWIRVACAYTGSDNKGRPSHAVEWADQALIAFDRRFNKR